MKSTKFYYWFLQILGWGLYMGLVSFNAYLQDRLNTEAVKIIVLLYTMAIFTSHLVRLVLIKYGVLDDRLPLSLLKSIFIAFAGAVLIYSSQFLVEIWVRGTVINVFSRSSLEHLLSILGWFVILIIWTGFYFAYHFFNKSRIEEIKNLQLEAYQNQILLNQLRAQLNPHFMFNALNSIKALVEEYPLEAKKAIERLSVLLRSTLSKLDKVNSTVSEEIRIVEAYLELEKIRFEERLVYSIEVGDGLNTYIMPPLMLQTIIENAVKHGISKLKEGGEIRIKIERDQEFLSICVLNSGTLSADPSDYGIGISNTLKRLNILYNEAGKFNLKQKNHWVQAEIKIPLLTE